MEQDGGSTILLGHAIPGCWDRLHGAIVIWFDVEMHSVLTFGFVFDFKGPMIVFPMTNFGHQAVCLIAIGLTGQWSPAR